MVWKLFETGRQSFGGAGQPASPKGGPALPDGGGPASDVDLIRDKGEFDLPGYCKQTGQTLSLKRAIEHYVREGENQRFNPCPGFAPAFYLKAYPDVVKAGVNGYAHYLRFGRSECRYPNQSALHADALKVLKSGQFDAEYYRNAYASVDYSRMPPVEHYLLKGWREGKRPNPSFDSKFYHDNFPDARKSGLVPLVYFIEFGSGVNRWACIDPKQARNEVALIEASGSFDAEYYRKANRLDAAEFENLSPLMHFVLHGARRWLDPNPHFSMEYYLRRYLDLSQSVATPYVHFLKYGKSEGRCGKPFYDIVFKKSQGQHDPSRPNLLLVLHECSQTGAPLLGLALIKELARRYNLVVWAGREGDLSEDIESAAFLTGYGFANLLDAEFALRDLAAVFPIDGAIANSVETSPVHRMLLACDIPSVGLIHEFASYTLPTGKMATALTQLDRCIFPAGLVKKSALQELESTWAGSANHLVVRPQGHLPAALWSSKFVEKGEADTAAQAQIAERMKGKKVVLGAGFVHIRKGVDLFIEIAHHVRETQPAEPVHFLWIGAGYAPATDLVYSAWLLDAIEKWGLGDMVTFMPAQKTIDWAFELADVFLLSSRLDPFPNVVVDALAANVPVVCFDETSGAADFIRDSDAPGAVVPYLDTRAAAAAIIAQLSTEHPPGQGARIVESRLAMPDYVGMIEQELELAKDTVARRRRHCEEIARAGCFDRSFYDGYWKDFPDDRGAIREYVAHCMKGIYKSAPYPGFNDGYYRARSMPQETGGTIPLVHALCSDHGARPRSHECIEVNGRSARVLTGAKPQPLKIALHMHLFYADLVGEFAQLLRKTDIAADLFISCPTDGQAREIQYHLEDYRRGEITIRRVPNAGRDIGPLITEFSADILARGYDLVGHLHGKKSKVLGPQSIGDAWRTYLWNNLLAGEGVWEAVHAAFADDPKLGLLFAEDHNIVGWTKNRGPAEDLMKRLELSCELPEIPLFPIGTMFWCRPQAIAPILGSGLGWTDYPPEPLPYDGTMLHAIERLLPAVCEHSGYAWKTIYLRDSTR